ncbi:FAD-binding oxidoreductase [Thioalkalivibrio sp. HK1]|uniref:FAD-binding oxidoreductase n=1 Tax=Thioalkalivibrio sp. HK1 TaxID=1469245 RepID=UPI000471C212|nr:FAD-linked oxidase C-terminal domain-containing protein [Thioalkalivibrio sp. HK1]
MNLPLEAATTLADELEALLPGRCSTAPSVLEQHGKDESYHAVAPPDIVVFPESTEEVQQVVVLCRRYGSPVIPFGTGTSLEGHVQALRGGVCIDVSKMDRILEVNADDLDCLVQPGVTRKRLNTHLRDTGLFFPIDPGADASLGGMAATRASGTNAVRYGTMRENVLGLTVVLADGRIIQTGGRAKKSAAGYDLTRLFVGSEGTLGVITGIRLRLYGTPEAISSAVCPFDTLAGAVDTVIRAIQFGIPVARIELLDEVQMDAVNRYSGYDYPVSPTLFFEFHGSQDGVREQVETTKALAAENGGGEFRWANLPEERARLWQARHDAYYASLALRPGSKGWATDVCVPISSLTECILQTRADIDASGLIAPIVGHVGDGNFHLAFVLDPDDPQELARAQALNDRMVERAQQMGGTCTGEHGVGYGKIEYMDKEHGQEAVQVMHLIKNALDPDNLMNPGKILPDEA